MKSKFKQKIKCFFGFHAWNTHVHNIETETECRPITIGFIDCKKCGKSKIIFIYG